MNNVIVDMFALLNMDNLAHVGAPSGIVEYVAVCQNHHGQRVNIAIGYFCHMLLNFVFLYTVVSVILHNARFNR